MGNLGSIKNMLSRLGIKSIISADIKEIKRAEKLILPGVGAFDNAMTNLCNLEFIPLLNELVLENRIPILGICLGMQLLSKRSEEGHLNGLGWIDAETIRFRFKPEDKLHVPHMGWNSLTIQRDICLFQGMYHNPRFYFVHSYHVKCNAKELEVATTDYGGPFTSSVMKENIYGVQFHPEKSHKFGMLLLKNFAELC
jgi:glutamine amidotransferase